MRVHGATLQKTFFYQTHLLQLDKLCSITEDELKISVPSTFTRTDYCIRCRAPAKFQKRRRISRYPCDKRFSTSFRRSIHYFLILNLAVLPVVAALLSYAMPYSIGSAEACRPGKYGSNRPIPRKMTPISYRQHVPNVSEKTIGASGPTEGKITRDTKRYREELIRNLNPDIVFKDEEQTNADRMMTERCRDSLNRLAMMVSEHWKNQVKLRVTEAWDEDGVHEPDSLHYEGRAVDVTTTDRDRRKYGMLARLAVEAGFDWVFYESRAHVHCSVKADKSDAARYGGCFSGDDHVLRVNGTMIAMSDIRQGDEVISIDEKGNVVPDRILTFMDRRTRGVMLFRQIFTESGRRLTLTPSHLIKVLPNNEVDSLHPNSDTDELSSRVRYIYAKSVKVGDYVFEAAMYPNNFNLSSSSTRLSLRRVISVGEASLRSGSFAPLTERGTILVNGVAASCYAVLEKHDFAHFVLAPLRYFHIGKTWLAPFMEHDLEDGVSWYPRFLYFIGSFLLPESSLSV